MGIFKKYRLEILLLLGIVVLFFVLRLPNLTLQPIFADEAIYIRWAQVMRAEPTLRFLPLSDGKTPLFMWVMIPLLKFFNDPLLAGRLLSGFATLVGVTILAWKFFGKRVALWSAFFVAVTPYMVFFDRMALVDSMLAAFSVWALFLAVTLVQTYRTDMAMFLGYAIGGGMLTKTPGLFNVLVVPVTLFLFDWKSRNREKRLLKILGLWVLAFAVAFLIYNILKLGPEFQNLNSRNQDYIHSPADLLLRPWDPFLPHASNVLDWFSAFLTLPTFLLVIVGGIWALLKKQKYAVTVLFWSFVPLLVQMAMLKTFTARYLLFTIPPLLILTAWFLDEILLKTKKRLILMLGLVVLFLAFSLNFSVWLLTDPQKAPLPTEERRGYLEDWTAGYGFPEIAEYLIDQTKNGSVVVGTEGFFGTLPDGLQIYLDKHSHSAPKENRISIVPSRATVSAELRVAAEDHLTFFVANKSRYDKPQENLSLIWEFPKPKGDGYQQDAILFYRVFPLKEDKSK
ncbi:glycosyltransferase family 39 protein [Candidatus Daviesbacteria bacterium]|nr:glycosyltransferase family 39 protein [Candidatus Daviesbacteria bacterium]